MEYKNMTEGRFLRRINRFSAYVELHGQEELVHVKNTGRCKELLVEGARVFLEKAANQERKTRYSLIAVYKGDLLINMDSQAPNAVAAEALAEGRIREIGQVDFVKREVSYGNSRFDIYYEKEGKKGFIEVKGVTLEEGGVARFPDAPTERGKKHIRELSVAGKEGYEVTVLFVIQMQGVSVFCPHWARDENFSHALQAAAGTGVEVLAYDCVVTSTGLTLGNPIPVFLAKE